MKIESIYQIFFFNSSILCLPDFIPISFLRVSMGYLKKDVKIIFIVVHYVPNYLEIVLLILAEIQLIN